MGAYLNALSEQKNPEVLFGQVCHQYNKNITLRKTIDFQYSASVIIMTIFIIVGFFMGFYIGDQKPLTNNKALQTIKDNND